MMPNRNKLIIAIDGPAGVGKSSVGKALAAHYGLSFFSTGIMYRCLGWQCLKEGVELSDDETVLRIAQHIKWGFEKQDDCSLKISINGVYPEDVLLTEEVGRAASKVSALPKSRALIMQKQIDMAMGGGLVMEGRDIGTAIAPWAPIKIYLIADAPARAKRRVLQLKESGKPANYDEILASIKSRDDRDSSRKTSPLRPADDAVIIDTSALTLEQVINKVLEISRKYAS